MWNATEMIRAGKIKRVSHMQRLFSIRAGAEHQSVSSHWEVTRPRPRATKANAQQSLLRVSATHMRAEEMRVGGEGVGADFG